MREATPGALVISLDFELRWGVLERCPPGSPYERNLWGAREVIPHMIELFEAFKVGATWATVGFLFARNRDELEHCSPEIRPAYRLPGLDSYGYQPGKGESSDPLHYAASLVELIRDAPRQELATHTFSHFYCGESGQDVEAFRADIAAAKRIASLRGVTLRSIVFPRNQHNREYDAVLADAGIIAYRGNGQNWMWRFTDSQQSTSISKRIARMADSYVPISGSGVVPWATIPQHLGLSDVRASAFLRGYAPRMRPLEGLRLRRIRRSMFAAARNGGIYHLWWHPHNFGAHPVENMAFLRQILEIYSECQERFGMSSLTMAEAAVIAHAPQVRLGRA